MIRVFVDDLLGLINEDAPGEGRDRHALHAGRARDELVVFRGEDENESLSSRRHASKDGEATDGRKEDGPKRSPRPVSTDSL